MFEYQHSVGEGLERSIAAGFDQWRQVDLPVLLDALLPKPAACMALEMAFPATATGPGRSRRRCSAPSPTTARTRPPGLPRSADPDGEEHEFCPCCLFTRSFEAFKSLIESDDFYAIRLYAARDVEGQPQADCRVNGQDWDAGKAALIKYVSTWPAAGYEFRKQYVVLQIALPGGARAEGESGETEGRA